MGFVEAVQSGFKNYAKFTGRATRSEYWWWVLFQFLILIVPAILGMNESINGQPGLWNALQFLISLGLLLPSLAVGIRRLHDTNRSGWWLLIAFIPFVGAIVLLVFYCLKGTEGPNKYGGGPTTEQLAQTFE
ncbi:MAG: DUF805 domain-containing protein [Asticcacaulis sp.]